MTLVVAAAAAVGTVQEFVFVDQSADHSFGSTTGTPTCPPLPPKQKSTLFELPTTVQRSPLPRPTSRALEPKLSTDLLWLFEKWREENFLHADTPILGVASLV
jgi:hypothetical protein